MALESPLDSLFRNTEAWLGNFAKYYQLSHLLLKLSMDGNSESQILLSHSVKKFLCLGTVTFALMEGCL